MDWASAIALIPMFIGIAFKVSDTSINDVADAEIDIVGSGIGIVFSAIALGIYAIFWANLARISEFVQIYNRPQGGAIGVVALTGLVIVGFVDGGWVLFGLAQLAIAKALNPSSVSALNTCCADMAGGGPTSRKVTMAMHLNRRTMATREAFGASLTVIQ